MNIKIKIDNAAVKAKMTAKAEDALKLMQSSILKDCNYYAPQDQSVLINSSIVHTGITDGWIPDIGKKATPEQKQALARAKGSEITEKDGSVALIARWETPYSRKMYYGVSSNGNAINYSREPNRNACKMWAHKAAAEKKEQWRRQLQKLIGGDN